MWLKQGTYILHCDSQSAIDFSRNATITQGQNILTFSSIRFEIFKKSMDSTYQNQYKSKSIRYEDKASIKREVWAL